MAKNTNCIIKYGFQKIRAGYESKQSLFKGLALFNAGHVLDLIEVRCGSFTQITSKVVRQTSVSLPPYDVSIELNSERVTTLRTCNCAAGAGGICKHISATIAAINGHSGQSKTDLPQAWGKPTTYKGLREEYSHAKRFEDLYPPPKRVKLQGCLVTSKDLEGIPCALRDMLIAEELSVSRQIAEGLLDGIVAKAVKDSAEDSCRNAVWKIVDMQLESESFGKTWWEIVSTNQLFAQQVVKNPGEVVDLAVKTIQQSDDEGWKNARAIRISASSRAHKIKTRRGNYEGLVAQFVSPKEFLGNVATRYGNRMEAVAIRAYEDYLTANTSGDRFKVVHCGLIVREPQPWLCASPDGIVLHNGLVEKLIEVKCPHKCVEKVIIDDNGISNVPYLTVLNGQITLKESHIYYTQVQLQLYVSAMTMCDFVVYSSQQMIILNISRDDQFISNVVSKIEDFYFKAFLPQLGIPINQ